MDKQTEIAEHAYYIWENKGRPHDRALQCWLEAEAEYGAAATVRQHMAKVATVRPARNQKAA